MKVAFSTLGCRVNQYESEAMAEKFIREGYEIVDFDGFSDVYVINTCTVTNMGDKKSRQIIGRARRENPEAIIAVVGCYAQISSREVSLIEGVNVVLGTRNKGDIVYFVNRARDENKQIIKVSQVLKNHDFEDLNIEEYQDRTRAFIKIQDGCNRFCSYCLIPYARGGVCSKDPDKVIQEIKNLAKHGFKEVILSGIHTASYGVDLDGNVTLVDILSLIEEIPGIERVRIGSIDPTFFTDEVLRKIKGLKKLCHHFHLSLQSGCDETLERMNRKYTSKEYKNIVEKLREIYDDVSITTDVIVGFPGESQEEFEKTYEFLKEIKLSKTHVFKFSPRKGTKAETMKDQVDGNIKDERSHRLIELNLINEKEFMNKFIGKTFKVLYEQEVLKENGVYEGYSGNYIKIKSKYSDENIIGKVEETIIEKVENDYAKGVIKD
ncbi:tRNA (N(6)-L-threonylcarbamoyladenosine(37)-C(2))-methylthiotransferase MtaB [Clostridium algidicarnis]|uniref:tRNA (N(6)-L-threonylcarbamoyladenosine(37)-C(2))- methylthiotransferase MtaB n=1 Tax=Clostridium algidicarnis TaxID=37659 RepID=UPI001C0D5E2F|nr:tRNA (N(6)-L-threonylcarbamoyladenosine(37)-C(2))-methylthiotransferase MtaB [Clostridium algidicarnis]MBU3195782.1 tRNA (N(6)-L-threonylcarbamoyladenosine(37)-C(2))-methylthiotransferase MtaB [Clostridium algidicarnis]MBU3208804.1 tRNA (N(6)-L-threonylcarbamoyladenosine(37)-C(2))-methylthiotransferase MtaB [Clostridium algidicarnis]MBU3226685.1 tRNA (N(6)-L-threonylcarbamoyladenosine(37)-C(2))-methylthiotransferase MtaB [Clostridium algidicarnis]MBU3250404.1 tRNA (N(6)-L-threonylcarbamoylad